MDALSKQNKGKGWGAGALHKDYTKQLAKLASGKDKSSKAGREGQGGKAGEEGQGRQAEAEVCRQEEGLTPWISAFRTSSG